MSQNEFLSWQQFYAEHPFDDAHRYHRPAALVAGSMAKLDMAGALKWLRDAALDHNQDASLDDLPSLEGGQWSAADRRTMKALLGG